MIKEYVILLWDEQKYISIAGQIKVIFFDQEWPCYARFKQSAVLLNYSFWNLMDYIKLWIFEECSIVDDSDVSNTYSILRGSTVVKWCTSMPDAEEVSGLNLAFFFFFCGTFHNIFKLDTCCTYSCRGTSGKKLPKPPWEGFIILLKTCSRWTSLVILLIFFNSNRLSWCFCWSGWDNPDICIQSSYLKVRCHLTKRTSFSQGNPQAKGSPTWSHVPRMFTSVFQDQPF